MDPEASSIGELLRRRAARHPERPFVIEASAGRTWTYRSIDDLTDHLARSLIRHGVRPGDRVGIVLPNGVATVVLLFGTLKVGAIFSPVNPALTPGEMAGLLDGSDPAVIFTTPGLLPTVRTAAPERRIMTVTGAGGAWSAAAGCRALPDETAPTMPALLLHTSGSTGRPKGALLTHENLLVNASEIAGWLGLDERDRMMCLMPLFHANALVIGLATPLVSGGSVVVCDRFSATRFWGWVERFQPTTFGSVATMLAMLLARGGPPPAPERCSLRFALCGSAPVPLELIERFRKTTALPIVEGYGLTECTCRATFNPPHAPRPGSAGLPIGNDVRIVDDAGADCAPGAIGEVVIRGRNVMAGYFRDPDATKGAIRNGWLHSADLGYRSADGFLYLVGRRTDMIIRGGENIYPREIEEILHRLEGVDEAAVVGVPDALYGEAVAAAIVLAAGAALTEPQVHAHCRRHLAAYKRPSVVRFVGGLPKNSTGKVLKRELLGRFTSQSAGAEP